MPFKCHPCCGRNLDQWLKILLCMDIITSAIVIHGVVIAIGLIYCYKQSWIANPFSESSNLDIHIATFVIFLLFVCIDVVMDVWLWLLVNSKDALKCRIWFFMKLVLEFSDTVGFTVEAFSGQHSALYIIGMTYDTLITVYFLWVLHTFIAQIKGLPDNRRSTSKLIHFTADGDSSTTITSNVDVV